MNGPYLASSFFSEYLLSTDPSILVDKVDPVPQNLKAGDVITSGEEGYQATAVLTSSRCHTVQCEANGNLHP